MEEDIVGLFAVVLSLAIPIVVMTFWGIIRLNSTRNAARIREQLIQNGADAEMVHAILEGMGDETKPKKRTRSGAPWGVLTWGCVLLGGGIGVVVYEAVSSLTGFDRDTMYICGALGVGLGLLAAFIIRWKLDKNWRATGNFAAPEAEKAADGKSEVQ